MSTILVVDDESSMVEMIEIMLQQEGYSVLTASDGASGEHMLDAHEVDLVISDMRMPKGGGIAMLKASLRRDQLRPVIVVTAYASANDAVEAMKMGAFDYITKPFNVDELKIVVRNALDRRNLLDENEDLKRQLKRIRGVEELAGVSKGIEDIREVILKVANSDASVLITGESGTGKELIARALHAHSSRCAKPFVGVNCGAVPENLLESELFGHVKGSFTGAVSEKVGLLESAAGGTFFLDEITEMPLALQVKLMRAIQEREIRRVGGLKDISLDVRFIGASNRDVNQMVKDGRFREDLFYRLNVVQIVAPPLRDRKGDIPFLANRFLDRFRSRYNKVITGFDPEVIDLMEKHLWRGNVRELENVVERAVVMETGKTVSVSSISEEVRYPMEETGCIDLPANGMDLEKSLEELEKGIIIKALERSHGSRKDAARMLNMNLRSLRYKIGKYEIQI